MIHESVINEKFREFLGIIHSAIVSAFIKYKKIIFLALIIFLLYFVIGMKYFLLLTFCSITFLADHINKKISSLINFDYRYFMFFILAYLYGVTIAFIYILLSRVPYMENIDLPFIFNTIGFIFYAYLIWTFKPFVNIAPLFIIVLSIICFVNVLNTIMISGAFFHVALMTGFVLIELLINIVITLPIVNFVVGIA